MRRSKYTRGLPGFLMNRCCSSLLIDTGSQSVFLSLVSCSMIKSRSSQTAAAAFSLIGVNRWALSGTPLQNRVGELYSLIRFLRIDPMAHYFCRSKVSLSINWFLCKLTVHCWKGIVLICLLLRDKGLRLQRHPLSYQEWKMPGLSPRGYSALFSLQQTRS